MLPAGRCYGSPRLAFSPLADVQRFLRLGYAARLPCCLLGLTLSLRAPTNFQRGGRLQSADAVVTAAHVADFVAVRRPSSS